MALIAWMAGIFYLPRLFVYHVNAKPGSDTSETFKVMERKLLRVIMNPAMVATWIVGLIIIFGYNVVDIYHDLWLQLKVALATILSGYHYMLSIWQRDFEADRNNHSERFYRIINEVPTLLMIGIVLLVIIRPF